MAETEQEFGMELNPRIIDAARMVVLENGSMEPREVTGYEGMFVARAECSEIQPMSYFTAGEVRYVIGPKRKKEKGW